MPLDQCDEVARCVAGERRAGEVWVGGEKPVGCAVEVGEVAAATAGDEDLFADAIGMIENEDAAATLTRSDGGHQTCCSGAEHQDIANLFVRGGGERVRGHAGLFLIMQPRYVVRVKRYIQSPPHHCG